jgi:hypothetical protein
VENVEAVLPREPRKRRLVPEYIACWRAKTLRDGDNGRAILSEIKQREIILKDEED